jgi:hypothetical protein
MSEAKKPKAEKPAPTGLELLRTPFPPNQISKLPKETRKQIDEREADRTKMVWNCEVCGGYHHKNAIHLDYVGHAALTDRLLDCDPQWNWRPVAMDGLPQPGTGMWIELTVCGVSRLGYGSADGKKGGDAIKEIIGDALRNAAMRFGAALDLWHKGNLHEEAEVETKAADEPTQETPAPQRATKANSRDLFTTLQKGLRACKSSNELRQWGTAFADDIKRMDKSFADEIRAEYKAEMNAFMDLEIAEEQANG